MKHYKLHLELVPVAGRIFEPLQTLLFVLNRISYCHCTAGVYTVYYKFNHITPYHRAYTKARCIHTFRDECSRPVLSALFVMSGLYGSNIIYTRPRLLLLVLHDFVYLLIVRRVNSVDFIFPSLVFVFIFGCKPP